LLAVSRLQASRDDRVLFSGVSFAMQPGDILQVAGPNGAGKTTLLNRLVGLGSFDDGDIHWQGTPVLEDPAAFRSALSFLGHLPGLKALLSPLENLRCLLSLRGLTPDTGRLFAALEKVGLAGYEDVPVAHLSAGQKRRVGIARLFLESAPLWVLDEPFTAIDQAGVRALEGWLVEHARQGGLVLLTTHHVFPAEFPAKRLDLARYRPEAD
jgi:heme exporter protein A